MDPNTFRRKTKSATTSKIGTSSYVEIAVNAILHDTDLEDLMDLSNRHHDRKVLKTGDVLRCEWTARVENWQKTYADGSVRVQELTTIKDLPFGALFLQHPESAMYLWTVMQAFYALDRLVCCNSATEPERWSEMSLSAYLESGVIQGVWLHSLRKLQKEINQNTTFGKKDVVFGGIGTNGPGQTNLRAQREALRRTDGIAAGIAKLGDAQARLGKNWEFHLGGIDVVQSLLRKINQSAERRFSMIKDTDIGVVEEKSDSEQDDVEIRSLQRSDSFGILKRELECAWKSTERGDISPFAILILLFMLVCLHRMRKHLLSGSDIGYIV